MGIEGVDTLNRFRMRRLLRQVVRAAAAGRARRYCPEAVPFRQQRTPARLPSVVSPSPGSRHVDDATNSHVVVLPAGQLHAAPEVAGSNMPTRVFVMRAPSP